MTKKHDIKTYFKLSKGAAHSKQYCRFHSHRFAIMSMLVYESDHGFHNSQLWRPITEQWEVTSHGP